MKKLWIITILFFVVAITQAQVGGRCPVCPPTLTGVTTGWCLVDSAGVAVWQPCGGSGAGNFWKTTGNASTVAGTNFIGTTDNINLVFKISNVLAGTLDTALGNTSYGIRSLYSVTSGFANTAIGGYALQTNSSGSNNTAIGGIALRVNTTGFRNTAVGAALPLNTTGVRNTGVGHDAFSDLLTGTNNTAIGQKAGKTITTGSYNTFVGDSSRGAAVGTTRALALGYNTEAVDSSIAIGVGAMATVSRTLVFPSNIDSALLNMNGGVAGGLVLTRGVSGYATWQAYTASSGTYTPTLSNTTNVAASTARLCTYSRVGNMVTVTGQFDIDPTLAVTATVLGISLPIASNFTTVYEAGGGAWSTAIVSESAGCQANSTTDVLEIRFICTDATNHTMSFQAGYEVK